MAQPMRVVVVDLLYNVSSLQVIFNWFYLTARHSSCANGNRISAYALWQDSQVDILVVFCNFVLKSSVTRNNNYTLS